MSFAVWLTGLSGSGKSTIARALLEQLHTRGVEVAVLESDVMRTQLTPYPRYDAEDRDFFYSALAAIGVLLVQQGRPVIFDATANRRAYRERARRDLRHFVEVFVDTPLEVVSARDTKGLYRKGSTATLPGVQAPYEAPAAPEIVVHGHRGTAADAAAAIIQFVEKKGWLCV